MTLHADPSRDRRWATLSLLLLAGLAALCGCGDSPVCVFGGNCNDDGDSAPGGIGVNPAVVPDNAAWIAPNRPDVVWMRPTTSSASSTTPIVLRFTESLNPDTLFGSFEIVNGTNGLPVPFLDPPALVGDGRVVVFDPLMDLVPGNLYVVQYTLNPRVTDLTGQAPDVPDDGFIGDFAVAGDDPVEPAIVATYPMDGTINQGDLTEIVVVFDRVMDVTTFDTSSWSVLVDGVPPLFNPPPVPYFIDGPTQIPVPSIFRWASINPLLERSSLGPSGLVELTLSPLGNELEDPDDNVLPETQILFDIAPIGAPTVVFKPTPPTDAFGRDELLSSDPVLLVDLPADVLKGDLVNVYVFGTGPDLGDGLEAISRTVDVLATTMQIAVTGEELDLLSGGSGRFSEGEINLAVQIERGNIRTALRLADSDPTDTGVQSYFFDVILPVILGLGPTGTDTSSVTSDVRDLVIIGRASEKLQSVRVGTDAGANNYMGPGDRPPVVISDATGLFVAAPVPLGVIDSSMAPPLFTVEVFDRAGNSASGTVGGRFDQLGAVGPGGDPTGGTMQVTVFDAFTLERLENALVITDQDDGGAVTNIDVDVTAPNGFVAVDAAAVGETIVTVDLPGYDLFTLHGAPRAILQVPLVRTGFDSARTGGNVETPFNIDLSDEDNRIGDSRIGLLAPRLFDVSPCSTDPILGGMNCPFGPEDIQPDQVGIQTMLSADLGISQAAFDAEDFLVAFTLRGPTAPVDMDEVESATFAVEALLSGLPAEEQAIGTSPEIFAVASAPNLGDVDGAPTVTIEAITPGLDGSSVVGLGLAYDPLMTEENWDVFAAYPGVVDGIEDGGADQLGELITQGTFEADLFMRAELVDMEGDSVGVRSRFSNLDGVLDPIDVPTFLVPGAGGMSGGPSYNIVVEDVIPDSLGVDGLYRITLTDTTGRAWTLWRLDPPGSGTVTVHVPNIGAVGGNPLAPGATTCEVAAFAWESLDRNLFVWSDVDREYEFFSKTAPVPFTVN